MVTIRHATPDDLAAVADVYLASRKAAYPAIPALVHDDDDVQGWIDGQLGVATQLWVAEGADGRVVAMMALEGEWLDQLYVDPAHTGSGVGSALLEFAKRASPAGLQLWTFESNARGEEVLRAARVHAGRADGRHPQRGARAGHPLCVGPDAMHT